MSSRSDPFDDLPDDFGNYRNGFPSLDVPTPGPIGLGVLVVVCLALAWYARPLFQSLVYGLYTTPSASLVVVLVLFGIAVLVVRERGTPNREVGRGVLVLGVLAFFAVSSVGGLLAGATLSDRTTAASERTGTLEESDPTTPRIVTRSVADRYASNTLQTPRYRIDGGDITVYNGTPYWSYALAPDGVRNRYLLDQNGTVLVDMTQQSANVTTRPARIDRGIGTAWYNRYDWRLKKAGEYLVNYEDPFMVIDPRTDEQYIAVPYTKPVFHWLPIPYTTPEWGGVALLDANGSVSMLSPQQAREHPALREQKLYPFSLARQRVAATRYRNGIVNTFPVIGSHRGEIELADVPGEGNRQPFFVLSADGPRYVVAVEPFGNAQGLREVWSIDARTGDYERFVPNESLVGARKATDFVRQDPSLSRLSWGSFTPSEPIPAVVDGQLWWEVRIVPNDGSGVSYVAFVNARTTDVQAFSTTAGVERFLRSNANAAGTVGNGTGTNESAGRAGTGSDGTGDNRIVIERVSENGTVIERVVIGSNESVRIVRSGANETTRAGNNASAPGVRDPGPIGDRSSIAATAI